MSADATIGDRVRRLRELALVRSARLAAPLVGRLPRDGRVTRLLRRMTWGVTSSDALDRYLVSGYQNPRINVQSILLRHELADRILPDADFAALENDELSLAVELNEALRVRAVELGVTMGSYLDPARLADVARVDEAIAGRDGALMARWHEVLGALPAAGASVLEMACGSANDYRAFVECGLARHLDYLGIDLTAKNIENARRRFPGIGFEVGDVTAIDRPDRSFDYVIASDIFEHLAPDAMERALSEAARIARRGVMLTFFNMAEVDDHVIQPRKAYFWNRLSRARVEERLRRDFDSVRVVRIDAMLRDRFGYAHTYNRHAVSIFATR